MNAGSLTVDTVETPDGPFSFAVDAAGRVIASGWTGPRGCAAGADPAADQADSAAAPSADPSRARGLAAEAVHRFYAGDFDAPMTVPVSQRGTPLQRRGWDALRAVPPGAPLTYAAFAEALGSPRAVRAAASICARNAVALFVPCHRVVRTGGGLGGFAWGLDVKRALLAREA